VLRLNGAGNGFNASLSSDCDRIGGSLSQIAEFSFILSGLGAHLKLIPEEGRDLILAGALLSDDLPAPLQPG
jgi:predicted Kef-type K+ transport protein